MRTFFLSAKTLAKKKGQLFSADFLIGVVVLTAVLGFSVQSLDLGQKQLAAYRDLESNAAQVLADANASGFSMPFAPPSCAVIRTSSTAYSDNCSTAFGSYANFQAYCDSRQGNVFAGRRIAKCPAADAACLLEVRTCD